MRFDECSLSLHELLHRFHHRQNISMYLDLLAGIWRSFDWYLIYMILQLSLISIFTLMRNEVKSLPYNQLTFLQQTVQWLLFSWSLHPHYGSYLQLKQKLQTIRRNNDLNIQFGDKLQRNVNNDFYSIIFHLLQTFFFPINNFCWKTTNSIDRREKCGRENLVA